MAYKDEEDILFVRVPMKAEEKQKIDKAVIKTGMKKYEWVRKALLVAASKETGNGTRN